jgi:LysR family transcriptional regulator, glycine cleavage system transcriptional activator
MPALHDVRLPSLDALRAFEASARLGSHERAAELLHVSASAVGKRVAALEDLLGTPLLSRRGKGLGLTAAGKEYLAQIGAALALLSEIPLHDRARQRRQRLRVSTPPTFARQILVPHLEQFTQAHPEVELELVLSIPYLDDAGTLADISVHFGSPQSAGATALMQDALLPVASPNLLTRTGPLREPADLAALPLLRTPLDPWAPWFAAAGLAWPEPQSGPKLVDLGLTLEAAVSGQGVALARPSLARAWIASGALRPLFAITARPAHGYQLRAQTSDAAAQGFARWLGAVCEQVAEQSLRDALSQISVVR